MNERRALELLATLRPSAPGAVLLWHGPDLDGSDVDIVVAEDHEHRVARALLAQRLSPAPQPDGRILWRSLDGDAVVIDVLPERCWPAYYPSLAGVRRRSLPGPAGLPAASAEDRLLIRAAGAVLGDPLDHVLRRSRPLLARSGLLARLREVAERERCLAFAELMAVPDRLEPAQRLPYRSALRVAARSPRGRAALLARTRVALGSPLRPRTPVGTGTGPGILVALSGMDGAGKSTAAIELAARLAQQGRVVHVAWGRLASENEVLDRIARPLKRALRRDRGDDAIAADAPGAPAGRPPGSRRRRGSVEWMWVVVVCAVNVRACRRAAGARRVGVVVVCDRWRLDALVDLEIRYGPHALARWVLRHGIPDAQVSVLLEVDPRTANARKPGDQAAPVLAEMANLYDAAAADDRFPPSGAQAAHGRLRIDATGDPSEISARVEALVLAALGHRPAAGGSAPGGPA